MTLKPDDNTKVKLSYEYFTTSAPPIAATPRRPRARRAVVNPFQSGHAVRAERRPHGVLRQPDLTWRAPMCRPAMAFIDHDFGNGLTVKNGTSFADYKKFYQNVYPGNGPLAGAVNPARHLVQPRGLSALDQPRQRLQPDRFRLQGLHRAGAPHHRVRNGIRPADRYRRSQHRNLSERHQYRGTIRSLRPISGRSFSSTSSGRLLAPASHG